MGQQENDMKQVLNFISSVLMLPLIGIFYLYMAIKSKALGISTGEFYDAVANEINKLENEEENEREL